jgi:DNA processing protein
MYNERDLLLVALQLVPSIGPRKCRYLIEYFTEPQEVFKASLKDLKRLKWMSSDAAESICNKRTIQLAEQYLQQIEKLGGQAVTFLDDKYPKRLLHTPHAPVVLYVKSVVDLNHPRTIGVVGTRHPTVYGRRNTRDIIHGLSSACPLVVSGLAYGIDICAHQSALAAGIPTLAVLGGGLDMIYPSKHRHILKEMYKEGGAITEFPPGRKAEREHFPMRNRILAGLCDILVVIESGEKGGSMITARLANDYNREVGALPGRVNDVTSGGTNLLIKNDEAHLIESAADVMALAQWNEDQIREVSVTRLMMPDIEPHRSIFELLQDNEQLHIDDIRLKLGLTHGVWSQAALEMQMDGSLRIGPGNMVSAIRR